MDTIQFHWENYKMRQAHVWKSLDRLILAVITLWAIPFIKIELFDHKFIIFLFPIVALGLSYFGKKLLKAEYDRLIAVFEKIKDEDPTLDFMKPKDKSRKVPITKPRVGDIMFGICQGLISLSFLDLAFITVKTFGIIKYL